MDEEYKGVKVLFRFYSEVLEQPMIETMWVVAEANAIGQYKLDSIPFYAPKVAYEDIVYAEYDEGEQRLTYRETLHPSGICLRAAEGF